MVKVQAGGWDRREAIKAQTELDRLRAIEVAARELGPTPPYTIIEGIRHCFHCAGPRSSEDTDVWQHDPLCEWLRFQTALGQGQRDGGEA
jgi:hypothetical protein